MIEIEYIGHYGFRILIGAGLQEPKTILLDPAYCGSIPPTGGKQKLPNYILMTHWYPQWQDVMAILKDNQPTLVLHEKLAAFLQAHPQTNDLTPITMNFGHEIDFPWQGAHPNEPGSVIMTVAEHYYTLPNVSAPIQANGFIIQAEGHQIYHAGPNQLTPELRTIGLTYKPNVAILPISNSTLGAGSAHQLSGVFDGEPADEQDGGGPLAQAVAQAVMWLGCDIVFPVDVSSPDDEPVNMAEIFSAIDIYTPAICRMLAPGDTYTLQPTESTGRLAGPESRY